MFSIFKYKKIKIENRYIFLRKYSVDFEVFDYVFKKQYHHPHLPILSEQPIILDLGSNIGLTVVDIKLMYPKSMVYGFEMDYDNYLLSLKNTKGLSDVFIFNKAVWFENTTLSYNKMVNYDAYKLSINTDREIENKINVTTTTINQIIADNKIEVIDYLKMDIEGAELEIFQNDLSWLSIVKEIKIEVHYPPEKLNFFLKQLDSLGFKTMKDEKHWSTVIAYKS